MNACRKWRPPEEALALVIEKGEKRLRALDANDPAARLVKNRVEESRALLEHEKAHGRWLTEFSDEADRALRAARATMDRISAGIKAPPSEMAEVLSRIHINRGAADVLL